MHHTTLRTFVLLLVPALLGAQPRRPTPEVFSSMEYNEESGDVGGIEVLVLRTARGVCVSYQLAEGEPERLRIIRAEVQGDSLVFRIPPDSAYESDTRKLVQVGQARWFRGRMTARGLRARIDGDVTPTWLPRRRRPYFPDSARQLSNESLQLTNARCAPAAHTAQAPRVRS